MAHIKGERPTAARYDPAQGDEERRSFENIILLCPNHHRRIDLLDPDGHPVEFLQDMKNSHEQACGPATAMWASESALERYALLVLTREPSLPPATGAPRLRIEKGPGESYEIINIGDLEAFNVSVMAQDDRTADALAMLEHDTGRLSPGARWRAFLHAATMGNAGPHRVKVIWTDEAGRLYDRDFPIG